MFELDVVLTKDDVLITLHDMTNERFTEPGIDMVVREHFYEELMKYNYAYNFEKDGEYPYRDLDESDPIFEQLKPAKLEDLFKQYSEKLFILELKDTVQSSGAETMKVAVNQLLELIGKYNMKNKVIISSFDDEVIKYVQEESKGEIVTAAERTKYTDLRC